MKEPKYVQIQLEDILQEGFDEYTLEDHVRFGWMYFELVQGCYGLPQARVANSQYCHQMSPGRGIV